MMVSLVGLVKTKHPGIAQLWADICSEQVREEEAWIVHLRAHGIKAAHPNDGWVKRDRKEVHFAYPFFNDGCGVGDLVMLGWPDKSAQKSLRLVRIIGFRDTTMFGLRWMKFEDVCLDPAQT